MMWITKWRLAVNVEYKPNDCHKARILYSSVSGFLIFACFLATSSLSYAGVYVLNGLQTASQGYTAESSIKSISFAQMEAIKSDRAWNSAQSNNNNLFGDGQYIGSMSFDLTPAPEFRTESVSVIDKKHHIDVASPSVTSGTGQSGLIEADIPTQFRQVNRIRLSDNDWVKWSNSGFSPSSSLTSEYLHLPEIIAKYPSKAEPIIAYPVPEPDSYAMILAGLALIAFTARRRNIGYGN